MELFFPRYVFTGDHQSMRHTWNPKKRPRRRKHGFLSRMATSKGQFVLPSRRNKVRWKLAVGGQHPHAASGQWEREQVAATREQERNQGSVTPVPS